MKKLLPVFALVFALIYLPGCNKYSPVAPANNTGDTGIPPTRAEQIALDLISQSSWAIEETVQMHSGAPASLAKSVGGQIISFIRQPITDNIVHYAFQVPVGPGPYDVIGIHRVVKEIAPNQPVNTRKTIFLQHGDCKDFVGMFAPGLYSSNFAIDFGFAVYLAKKNVDVWGIDQSWALVPAGLPDYGFMADWNLQKMVDNLNLAISVMRVVRKFMGTGYHKVILCCYSSGTMVGYALLNQETQIPEESRQVSGYIPAEMAMKFDDPGMKEAFKNDYYYMKGLVDNGQYQADSPFPILSQLAKTVPDGDSPVIPGFTNLQAALYMAAGQVFGENVSTHYIAGIFDNGMPVGLRYITIPQWLDFMESGPPFLSAPFEADGDILGSGLAESPYDDYLSQIQVPIFNIGAAGGLGPYTIYMTTLLGSTDITNLLVSTGQALPEMDIAHVDMFIASNADRLFWRPMFDWIQDHSKIQSPTSDKFVDADVE
jgi:hypothetical protein